MKHWSSRLRAKYASGWHDEKRPNWVTISLSRLMGALHLLSPSVLQPTYFQLRLVSFAERLPGSPAADTAVTICCPWVDRPKTLQRAAYVLQNLQPLD